MKTFVSASIVAALAAFTLTVTSPANAGEAIASTPLGSVQVVVEDDTFEVSGCLEVPLTLTVAVGRADTSWSSDLEARLEGTASIVSSYQYGEGSATDDDYFQVCPSFGGAGRWLVSGEVTMRNYETDEEYVATLTTSFVVAKAKTQISIARISARSYSTDVTGKITSRSEQWGTVGVSGSVSIQVKKGRRWVEVGTGYSDNRGNFEATVFETLPRKTTFRAVYRGSDSTLGSVSKPKRF